MKTKDQLKAECIAAVLATSNDINEYLKDYSVPLECHVNDINMKMNILMDKISSIFIYSEK